MKTLLIVVALLLFAVWAVSFMVFKASDSIHLLLLIDFLILLKALKPEREERITRITSERNFIK
ncbi:MAG: hypothetical protein ACM3ME_10195 [Chloroflexota bacterium]|nr:hypothetical protein [Lentimicrobium sp.]